MTDSVNLLGYMHVMCESLASKGSPFSEFIFTKCSYLIEEVSFEQIKIKNEFLSFKSNESIHKNEDGSNHLLYVQVHQIK